MCDNGFYETFNLPHVEPVNIKETPIERITPEGILTSDGVLREFDVIVFATGFDAVDGNYRRMNLTGRDGVGISEHWAENPTSYLGVTTPGFPNWFMVLGPKGPFTNLPTSIEVQVEWIAGAVDHARREGIERLEPTEESEQEWSETCRELAKDSLFGRVDSWIFGANVPGKKRSVLFYLGGLANYRQRMAQEAQSGYSGLTSSVSVDA